MTTGMNDDRAFERGTRSWLEAGSDSTPAAAIDAVLLAVRTTPQERDLRIPRRIATMPTPLRLVAAIAIFTVVGLAAVSLFKASPIGSSPTTSPTVLASPTTPPSATPIPSPTHRPTAAPPSGSPPIPHGPLAAGTYTTSLFTPTTTFTVPTGWLNGSETVDRIGLNIDKYHQVSIARVQGDPLVNARTNPEYTVGTPVPTTFAGRPAEETTFVLSADAHIASFYPLSALAETEEGTLELPHSGTEARIITFEVSGTPVVILVSWPIGDTTDFDAKVQALLATITFP